MGKLSGGDVRFREDIGNPANHSSPTLRVAVASSAHSWRSLNLQAVVNREVKVHDCMCFMQARS
jgi:hypothetical protein